jgi:glycosyltransferase involved in cell wall biosynthesis
MLSIIIPTFNEEKYLPLLLRSIRKQTFKDYEIIVADNNSIDLTSCVASKFGAKVVKGGTPAQGRNRGAQVAKGEWLLFLDADVVLPKDFLKTAMEEIGKSDCSAVSCLAKPLSDKKVDKILHNAANLYILATKKTFSHAAGFCIFSKSQTHRLIGGFDESLKMAEDHDYVYRINKIAKFDILKSVQIPVSVRRLNKDGRLNIAAKYVAVEMHLIFWGPVKSKIFNYDFGDFD